MRILSQLRFRIVNWLVSFLSKLETHRADPADIYFCYRLLLGRRPEAAGWQDWCQRARQGLARDMFVDSVLASREFVNRHRAKNTPQPVQTAAFCIYVDANDLDIGQPIVQTHSYEPHVTAVLTSLLKEDDVFLDIGANMGWFTLTAAAIARRGKVLAVEPNASNVQLLYRSLIANQFQHVTVFPYAATDTETLLRLDYAVSNGYVTAIEGNLPADEYAYVQGVRLDDVLNAEPQINLVKIDVEGHELFVWRGMQAILTRHRPIVITEFSPRDLRKYAPQAAEEYLHELLNFGYTLAVIEAHGAVCDVTTAREVMEYWQTANQKQQAAESVHLDLLARPA